MNCSATILIFIFRIDKIHALNMIMEEHYKLLSFKCTTFCYVTNWLEMLQSVFLTTINCSYRLMDTSNRQMVNSLFKSLSTSIYLNL